jgi:hypothetical protein
MAAGTGPRLCVQVLRDHCVSELPERAMAVIRQAGKWPELLFGGHALMMPLGQDGPNLPRSDGSKWVGRFDHIWER